jgi:RHS repeat-associated protein
MRTFVASILLTISLGTIEAQVTGNRNVVVQNALKKPGIQNTADITPLSIADKTQQVQYFDGLGRPLQTVMTQAGTGNRDIIMPMVYDEYGREIKKYKPYADVSNSGLGSFRANAYVDQSSYYAVSGATGDGARDNNPYAQTLIEFSPLGRVIQAGAPGQTWQPGSKPVAYSYHVNTVADMVRIVRMSNASTELGGYEKAGDYVAGELTKVISKDENGKQVIEFKDKEGKVILKKVQLTATVDNGLGSGTTGWLCTYYIYDGLNNLRGVIQPVGVKELESNGWSFTADILGEQCFRYDYDSRRRMIVKKVPGALPVYMVYDKKDNLVMTQDGNLRTNGLWMLYRYDSRNFQVESGVATIPMGVTRNDLQADANSGWGTFPNSMTGFESHIKTFYDNYSWIASLVPASLTSSFDNLNTYLDQNTTVWPYAQLETSGSGNTRGKVTGTRLRILGSSDYLYSVNIYDEDGRVIQVKSTSISGGIDVITTQYTWAGQPLMTVQQMKNSAGALEQLVVTRNKYTAQGLLDKVEKRVQVPGLNGGALGNWVTVSKMDYDQLGKLKTKSLGYNTSTSSYLETLANEYNIRDWLLGVNRGYINNSTTNWFGFELAYENTTGIITANSYASSQFNGNINGTTWKSKGDQKIRRFDYQYDAANRLTNANFGQYDGSAFTKSQGLNFSVENLNYDANGNIMSMRQFGWQLNGSKIIDELTYSYLKGGLSNQLKNVLDNANDAQTKLGDFKSSQWYLNQIGAKNSSATDYAYDYNGNLTQDLNKAIPAGGITYNVLNLPSSVVVKDNGNNSRTVNYVYDATGNKLKKIVVEPGQPSKTTTYRMGSIYENDTLQFTAHEEGRFRIVRDAASLPIAIAFDYFIKDHLGNVRMVLTSETKTDPYLASMETAVAVKEEALFSNVPATRIVKPAGYPVNNYTTPDDYVAQVRGDGQKIGPSKLLKVMAGDKINFQVTSWYKLNGSTPSAPNSLLTNLINVMAMAIGGLPAGKGSFTDLINSNALNPAANSIVSSTSTYTTSKPKAFVNWILLDEQFNYVPNTSGFEQVGNDNQLTPHIRTNLTMPSSGYLYIYVSNETPNISVFFDNLQISHVHGPLLEETHYYPFGLAMAGISSKALNGTCENKYKFNKASELQNKEFSDGSGLDWYATQFRSLDPQLGRWWQIDPKPDMAQSLYSSMGNNPVRYNDPLGDTLPMPYSELAANYPTSGSPKEMYNSVGGKVAEAYNKNEAKGDANPYANTCALRMSVALNKSGNDLDTDVKNSKGQKMFTLEGGDGKDYALRKSDVKDYMGNKYGKADISTTNGDKDFDEKINDVKGQKGVVVFDVSGWSNATGHITIYDGKGNCGHDCYFPDVIKKENATREGWNASHPNESPLPMIKLTGVSLWIAK